MQAQTIQQLLDINYQFYQTFGGAFAATRRRVQPGIRKVLEKIPPEGCWLDLGCGSGALAQLWIQQQRTGCYHGLDFSAVLLAEAKELIAGETIPATLEVNFMEVDLLSDSWSSNLPRKNYDGVVCFAAMHHIPGYQTRLRLVQMVRTLIPIGGLFIHSNWQFQHSPRLLTRVQAWSQIGIDHQALEEGDTLLDWRYALAGQKEQVGYRYVHRFSQDEFERLAKEGGFQIDEVFESDGDGGRLGYYQIWRAI
ncbi:MAG TPA: class I SAM-dependent methyltransferase [Anaerolineaceae bacterium]|nr:class I SAM-dependent methyltransferase [Anaerolineaceae bacterium]